MPFDLQVWSSQSLKLQCFSEHGCSTELILSGTTILLRIFLPEKSVLDVFFVLFERQGKNCSRRQANLASDGAFGSANADERQVRQSCSLVAKS